MDLLTVVTELEGVTNAHELGLQLGISGAELAVIERNHPRDAQRQKIEVVKEWLNRNTNPTWRAVAKALKQMHLDAIAAKIEEKYQTRPVVLQMNSQQIASVVAMINSVIAIANKPEVRQPAVVKSLSQTLTRLSTGKVHAGIVGLTKAGKSTTLNAMLDGTYLPSSIQEQTAGEVGIEHRADLPKGTLVGMRGSEPGKCIASGRELIHDTIREMNARARANPTAVAEFSKLTLQAPMHFLKDATDVSLEIFDTPGVKEAGSRHISEIGGRALKDLCAFVVILNLQFLPMDGNSQLLRTLEDLHPDILTELNRILILVNAYDITFEDDNVASLKAEEIPRHVSERLKRPDILGVCIPPDQIIPYSARWALRAREWSGNPSLVLKGRSKTMYSKAVNLLCDAGYEAQVDPLREMNEANLRKLCRLLEEFSRIQRVEDKLEEMLYRLGPKVLVRGACSDAKGEIRKLRSAMKSFAQAEGVEKQEATVEGQTQMIATIQNIMGTHVQSIKQLPNLIQSSAQAQLNATTAALENSISGQINTKVVGHLSNLNQQKDRQTVHSRICSIKTVITTPSANEMQASWSTAMTVARDLQTKQVNTILSQLKTELTAQLSRQVAAAGTDPGLAALGNTAITQITRELGRINPASLLPVTPTLQLPLSTDSITDASLNAHITAGTVTEHRQVEHKVKGSRKYKVAGPKKKHTYTESVPYQVPVYSANVSKVVAAYTSLAPLWRGQFQAKLNEAVTESSGDISQQAEAAVTTALTQPQQDLKAALDTHKAALEASKRKVQSLATYLQELEGIEKGFKP